MAGLNHLPAGQLNYRIDFHLAADDHGFRDRPVGQVDIAGTRDGTLRIIRRHDLYPQDFRRPGVFQVFSLELPGYLPGEEERLEFRVWTGGVVGLALRGIDVVPLAFRPGYGSWGNVPWDGGDDSGPYDRIFDPRWILTSRFHKDGRVEPLPRIDWWRRDILVGRRGVYPYIGPYDVGNPEVLRYQMRQAAAAGIDGFQIYAYFSSRAGAPGIEMGGWNTAVWRTMLEVAAREGFSVFLNDSTLSERHWFGGPYTGEDAVHNLRLAVQEGWLDHPGYARINGRPLYDLPLLYERDPAAVADLVRACRRAYREAGGRGRDLYLLMTNMTTYGFSGYEPWFDGPYNTQTIFMDDGVPWRNRERDFVCDPPAGDMADLLQRGRCRHDPARPASGYCVFLATLLEREELAGFRWLSQIGLTSLYDWNSLGPAVWPQYLHPVGGRYVWGGSCDPRYAEWVYRRYVDDAHCHGYGATVTFSPGHDKSGAFRHVHYEIQPYLEPDGRTLRMRRLLAACLAARPDIILIENWNGYAEAVHIEPSLGFYSDVTGREDAEIYLEILAEGLGRRYRPPLIPVGIVDPLRLPYIPRQRLTPLPALGDLNVDGRIDREDAAILLECWSGPQIAAADPLCLNASLDADNDVDADDLNILLDRAAP